MNEEQQYNDYVKELSGIAQEQDKARLRSLALSFHSTLQRLPKLEQEISIILQSTDNLDYEELVKRVETTLQQASDWLLKIDLLPSALANDTSIQENITKLQTIMTLSTVSRLITHFDNELKQLEQEVDPEYCYNQVYSYFEDNDPVGVHEDRHRILKWLEKAANLGHSKAQFQLASVYHGYKGITKRSPEKAIYWLEKAAKQGNFAAQFLLDEYSDNEHGILRKKTSCHINDREVNSMMTLLSAHAQCGDELAQFSLGKRIINGDDELYNKWAYEIDEFNKSASKIRNGSATEKWYLIHKNWTLIDFGIQWLEKGVEKNANNQLALALYYTNETLPKNLEKAIYWMQKSAEQGNKTAIDWLKNNKF